MIAPILALALAAGLLARALGLPPLVGFLIAGFSLRAAGHPLEHWLEEVAHAGVLVLLFSVGLKLRLKNLARAEVFGGASVHLLVFGGLLAVLIAATTSLSPHALLVMACALGFSSTVVAAKVLEEKRELRAFHGRVAVGILVVQDVVAVALLSTLDARAPSWWAPALVAAVVLSAPLLQRLLDWAGRGELMVLLGLTLTLCLGGFAFSGVGLSEELGALLVGTMIANHPNAAQLSYRLWSLKEVLLAGFFVAIGMAVIPDWTSVGVALALVALLPLKAFIFFLLLVRFRLRARSSFLAAIALASYSEFGLIVATAMGSAGLISSRWIGIMALSAALSFIVAAPLNRMAHPLFDRLRDWLVRFERPERHPDDRPISLGSAEIVVFGMGRVGTGAYEHLKSSLARVVGLDSDPGKVQRHLNAGRRVVYADAEDPDLWDRLNLDGVRAVLLALPDIEAKQIVAASLRRSGFKGFISATTVFEEERQRILDSGCDATFNYFDDAGVGFAKLSWEQMSVSESAVIR